MSAKEMFKELGYKREENDYCIYYMNGYKTIEIWLNQKVIQCNEFVRMNTNYIPSDITFQELQAINKQVEELHWND